MMFCLDDGTELLYGPASGGSRSEPPTGAPAGASPSEVAKSAGGQFGDPQTAILSDRAASAGGQFDEPQTAILHSTAAPGEAPTRAQIHTTEQTAILSPGAAAEPHESLGGETKKQSFSAHRAAKPLLIVLGLAVIGLAVFFGYRYFSSANSKQIDSIAVMPFVNDSGNAEMEYLSDGMTETLISSLSQIAGLNVKARSSVFRYKGKDTDARTIGKDLGVQAVLNGRLVQRGDQLTLSLELIDAANENVIWQDKYDRKATDILKLQTEIARDVSSKLKLKLTSADELKLAKKYTSDPEVYRLFLQGRYYWNKRTFSEVAKGVPFFQQAIAKDPNFALGYVGLADSNEDENRPQKLEYIRRALEIDPDLAEAHASLGYQLMCKQDWVASERELKRAQELNPNYAQAYAWNGIRMTMIGKYDEALAELDRALAIEPTANSPNFYKAATLAAAGRREVAIQYFKRIIEMDPTFSWAYSNLARQYFFAGDIPSAVEQWARSVDLEEGPEKGRRLREAFASGGWKAFITESKTLERTRGWISIEGPQDEAAKEKLIADLQRRVENGNFWLFQIRHEPTYDPLRGDPRFQEILKRFDPPQ
jgi:TolB-like protein/Flp pilus assembly protein TadD